MHQYKYTFICITLLQGNNAATAFFSRRLLSSYYNITYEANAFKELISKVNNLSDIPILYIKKGGEEKISERENTINESIDLFSFPHFCKSAYSIIQPALDQGSGHCSGDLARYSARIYRSSCKKLLPPSTQFFSTNFEKPLDKCENLWYNISVDCESDQHRICRYGGTGRRARFRF